MSFPLSLTAALTGASPAQLRRWRISEVLVPEDHPASPSLYSFRDLVALRSIVYLRSRISNQKLRRAMHTLRHDFDLTDHPSRYAFATDGRGVEVLTDQDEWLQLVHGKGQMSLIPLEKVLRPFTNLQGQRVVDFERPRTHLQVVHGRMGGWPTIADTRVPYDTIADLLREGDLSAEQVSTFYPSVSAPAARDAADFDAAVRQIGPVAA